MAAVPSSPPSPENSSVLFVRHDLHAKHHLPSTKASHERSTSHVQPVAVAQLRGGGLSTG
ncbi:hypothetical protein IAQ61_001552 [Plenodomus lingam]|uniref:uncharacterized protein n=1 Tax=Leptosphaeria maculans TaxID=5022 RepID=UPI003323CC23|nr:hypothetical protein IAQ61_001552 [Plenodomus lingam]